MSVTKNILNIQFNLKICLLRLRLSESFPTDSDSTLLLLEELVWQIIVITT